jgi:putative membrane protein
MPRTIIAASLLALALAMSPAIAQDASSYPSSADQIQPAAITDPQEFVTKAGSAGMFEIQSSQLALAQSQNADIKSFAQMMVEDHSKAADNLKKAAAAQGNLNVPDALDADSAAKLQQLQGASGGDFDKLYVQMQTDAHVQAVALFSGYAQNGPAGPVKDFAAATEPTLKMHYEHVLTLPH